MPLAEFMLTLVLCCHAQSKDMSYAAAANEPWELLVLSSGCFLSECAPARSFSSEVSLPKATLHKGLSDVF